MKHAPDNQNDPYRNRSLRWLSNFVILYMLMAFSWWAVLLYSKNKDALQTNTRLLQMELAASGNPADINALQSLPQYAQLEQKHRLQQWMILGEAAVFIFTLIIGVWLINRSYAKELQAARQRRNFLLSITHELKSPLASIRLALETMLKYQLGKEKNDQLSTTALRETERLTRLVDNLLLAAKVETAYVPVFEAVDLAEMTNDVVTNLAAKYPLAVLHFEAQENLPPIEGEPMGLTSVIVNLVENAVKYAGEQPEVWISLYQKDQKIVLRVADNGPGIPEHERDRIFERFYRIGSEETRKTKGTGLGLYIVDQLIRAHHGKITVAGRQQGGTTFEVSLPLRQTEL